ncbi:MAG TPA: tetratricopeptide repeat protein [Gemmatales bacterium]|nr:tetratricopeptide repeat protein [Gemmatales bacterium]HMP17653.1 tetratricopeptide repeat protein [Gemmatales bacterium]
MSRKAQLLDMLQKDPHDPFLRYGYAKELEAEGDTDGAIAQLQQLLKDSPEYVPAFLQVGQLLIRVNRLDEARTALTMGMQTAFKQADHHAYGEMEGILASIK